MRSRGLLGGKQDGRVVTGERLEGDAGLIGEHFEGFAKLDAFQPHDEAEDVAAYITNPALERLPLRVDLETGLGVVVPRAQPHVDTALPPQLYVFSNEINNVGRLSNQLFRVQGRSKRHRWLPCVKMREIHSTSTVTSRQFHLSHSDGDGRTDLPPTIRQRSGVIIAGRSKWVKNSDSPERSSLR